MWRNSKLLPSILTGILIGTSYIPFPPWASVFCLIPLWWSWLKQPSLKHIWWSGWIAQFTLTLIGFNWVAYTAHEFGHLPWPISFLALILFASFASLHFPLGGVLWWLLVGRNSKGKIHHPLSLLALPACLILTENFYPMIFDWNMGYSWLPTGLPLIHTVEWIGVQGLSALTILANGALLVAWVNQGHTRTRWAAGVAVTLVLLMISGAVIKSQIPKPGHTLQVGIVQANIGNFEKQEAEKGPQFREAIVSSYLNLSEKLLSQSPTPLDFVVWPETAVPDFMDPPFIQNLPQALRVQEFVRRHQTPLVTGAYSFRLETRQVANGLFVLGADGQHADERYAKTHLLAFGEYLPGSQWMPFLKNWFPATADFERGTGARALNLNGIKIGPQICYEGLFPHFARGLSLKGAQVIVNVTNDSWYGKWQEPYQHMHMTLARALELRIPVIRSTNTGISTVALADGLILERSPLHEEWVGRYEIPYLKSPRPTVFARFGFLFAYLLPGVLLMVSVFRLRNVKENHN